jgi:uncharacterized delta-60 repeat protein
MHRVFTISLFFFVTTFSLAQTYDESFKPVITANATILAIARQSDGKVLVAGNFTYNGAASIGNLIRINTDGTLDATFKKVVTDAFVFDIKVQADGKILIGGAFQKVNTTTRLGLARLNSDGTVDDAFNAVPGFANTSNNIPWVNGIGIQSDNKIVIQGYFEFVNNSSHRYIARLNADGSTDEAFQTALTSSGGSHELYPVVIQTDGKILIAGRFTKVNDVAANRLARLNTDGSLDTGFGNNIGTGPNNTIRSMALQSDGKILIGGIFNQFNGSAINQVARLNSNGTLDSGFPANIGFNSGNFVTSVFVQPDQKIVVGGNFQDPKPRILRLNTNGTMDANFDPGTGFTANGATSVYAIELMGSQYLFGGDFIQYNNNIRPGLARVNSNGTIDNTFDLKLGTTGGVFAAAVQSNGKIIIGGNFLYVNGTLSPRLARLNTNGTLDTFTAGTGFSNTVRAVHVLADGKVIVGGIFTHYNGTSISRLVRLNSNGTLDNTFSVTFTTSFTSSGVYGIKPAPGNKLLIFGGFSSVNSNATKNVALLNLDGTSASTFVGDNLTSSWITDADIRSDGYIIATSNVNEGEVRLLNSNGTIRTSFGLQGKLNSNPATAIFDTDGNIVFGGYQISYSGSSFRKIFKTDFTANLLPFNYQLIDQNVRVNKIVKHNNKYFVGKTFLAQPQTHSFEWVNEAGQVLPNAVNTTGGVHTFLTSGSNLYIGGSITEINGDAVHSFVRVVLPAAPNAAPSSLNATAQRGKVTLTWTDNSDNEAGFDVYRSEDNGASYALLGTTKDASYTDNTVAPETAYRYYVEATNLGGSSSPSNIASITSAEDVPPAPSKLVITMEAQINAKLTWQDNAKNETEYRVYRYSSSEGPSSYVLYKTLPANTTTFTDPQLIPGTSYSYYVKAFNSLGESLQTNTESATFSLPSPTWANVPDATGVERSSAAYFVIGNKGYVGTGRNASGRLKDFWEFDPATGWTKKKDFPGSARTAAVGFSINGKGYIGLGNDGSGKFKTDFYEYDPVADDWKAVAEFPADPNSEGGLSSAASFVIGNYGYVGLGNSGLSNVKTFMRFDPVANKWEPMAAFGGSGRPGAIGFAINGKGYFGLGGVDPKLSDIWEYNPVTNSWTSFFNNQISGRSGATAFVIHNRAYMGLGDAGDLFTENLQVNFRGYDFSTRNWFVMPDYTGVKRTGAIAFVINNTAYVGLGSAISGSVTNYYSDMKSFQPLSALTPEAPSALTAALEPGGTSITLNWTDQSSNETGFIIQRSVGTNSTSFMRIGTVEANTTTFTDTDLVSGTVYNYRVAALNN